MKRFDLLKTIQLAIMAVLTVAALITLLRDRELYAMAASHPGIRFLCILLWLALGISFGFLFYDFQSYAGLKRENTELDNAVYQDALTGVANRYSVDTYIGAFLHKPLPEDMGCITMELTNLGEINKQKGHEGGDAAIRSFSEILAGAAEGVCFIGRNGGNKFVAIFRECSLRRLEKFEQSVSEGVKAYNEENEDVPIRYSAGTAFEEGDSIKTLTELVALSDRRAYENA